MVLVAGEVKSPKKFLLRCLRSPTSYDLLILEILKISLVKGRRKKSDFAGEVNATDN